MGLIQKLYPQDEEILEKQEHIWDRFLFFSPNVRYLGHKVVRNAISNGNSSFFIQQIRDTYFPDQTDAEIQENYRQAMNRGITSINALVKKHLGGYAHRFIMQEISAPLDFFDFIYSARDEWIKANTGRPAHLSRNSKKQQLLLQAYQKIKAWGLAYHVLMIDESIEVTAALRDHNLAINWIKQRFRFNEPTSVDLEDFSHVWQTEAGARVYGSESAFRSRVKSIDIETGMPTYGSIITKMLLKGDYPDKIRDYVGIEFVVEDKDDVEKLLSFFRRLKGTGKLEDFEDAEVRNKKRENKYSGDNFECTKFFIRPAVAIEPPPNHPFNYAYERTPIEVQIYTLRGHEQRKNHPDLKHQEYKKRQFRAVIPILFPLKVYNPFLP